MQKLASTLASTAGQAPLCQANTQANLQCDSASLAMHHMGMCFLPLVWIRTLVLACRLGMLSCRALSSCTAACWACIQLTCTGQAGLQINLEGWLCPV